MFYDSEQLTERVESYCKRLNKSIQQQLGRGMQGMVFLTKNSALKIHYREDFFRRELDAYGRLAQFKIQKIRSVTVPILTAFDPTFLILEMSVVRPPFLLDFGGAYLDRRPAHALDPNVVAQWMVERREKFGDRVREVNGILAELETYGIYFIDVHPGNLKFE